MQIFPVEIWYPTPNSSHPVGCETVFYASSRERALDYIAQHPTPVSQDFGPWCWFIMGVELDDPKAVPLDKMFYDAQGVSYPTSASVWALF